jgi:DNA-binding NarL/FixJ family response regulator
MKRPRVLLADDHAMVIAGLSRLLEPDFELAGTAEEVASYLKPWAVFGKPVRTTAGGSARE